MLERMLKLVERFNREIVGMTIPDRPTMLTGKEYEDRRKHMLEEMTELRDAKTVVDQADALIDLVYVALGGLLLMGVTPGPVFEEVHNANMQRIKTKQENGKLGIVKPAGWQPPDLEPLLELELADVKSIADMKMRRVPRHVSAIEHTERVGDISETTRLEFPDRPTGPVKTAVFASGGAVSTEEAAMAKKRAKTDLTMVPTEFLNPTARTFMFGAEKYSKDGYKNNDYKFSELVAALMRHAREFMDGKDLDLNPETALADKWGPGSTYSGLPIIGNMGCCVAMLAWRFKHKYQASDDRFYSPDYDGRFRAQVRK